MVFGRWLLAQPRLYIFEEPTVGVDVGTKLELYRVIRRLADEGAAVLVLSSDLIELIGVCDRILVVAHGSIVDSVTAAEATEERIIGSAVRKKREHAVAEKSSDKDSRPKCPSGKHQRSHSPALCRRGSAVSSHSVAWRLYDFAFSLFPD